MLSCGYLACRGNGDFLLSYWRLVSVTQVVDSFFFFFFVVVFFFSFFFFFFF